MISPLHVAAGPAARRHLQRNGLQLQDIRAMLGASGGPKWLVLNRLDRVLAPWLAATEGVSLDLLGTSIGSWRFACYAQPDPEAAFDRFEAAYFEQHYSAQPTPEEISAECGRILDALLGSAHQSVTTNPRRRLHLIANRCRPAMLGRNGLPGRWPLARAALANTLGRRHLARHFERLLFAPEHSQLPFGCQDFVLEKAALSADNLRPALMATASIPLLMAPVCDIPGTSGGVCVDGGITDYHFDSALPYDDGIVLYLHFSPRLVPGWFDKLLPWRRPRGRSLDNVLLVTPSAEFIARLPNGRIPDRHDFLKMDAATRLASWRRTLAETEQLAEALADRLARQQWGDVATLA